MWHPKSKTSTYPHGLIHKHIEVTLPLSKQICFLASWNKEIRTHIDISQSDVEELNQMEDLKEIIENGVISEVA